MEHEWNIYGKDTRTGLKRELKARAKNRDIANQIAWENEINPAYIYRSDQLIEPPLEFRKQNQQPKPEVVKKTNWTDEPVLSDYGLTVSDTRSLQLREGPASVWTIIGSVFIYISVVALVFMYTTFIENDFCIFVFFSFILIGFILIFWMISLKVGSYYGYGEGNKYNLYQQYQSDLEGYRRYRAQENKVRHQRAENNRRKEREDFLRSGKIWTSIDPYQFEVEVAKLFTRHGYSAEVTKGSDDGGIDIHVEKNGVYAAIQCKQHASRCGPGPVRELCGVWHNEGYNYVVLVCTGGFSSKAIDYANQHGVILMDLERLIAMNENRWQPLNNS